MKYEITYAPSWTKECPTCGEWTDLFRPHDEPHKELYGTCENCQGKLAGFIHPGAGGVFRPFVIDLNVGEG